MSRVDTCVDERELIADANAVSGFSAQHDVALHGWKNGILVDPEDMGRAAIRHRRPRKGSRGQHAFQWNERLVEFHFPELTDDARERELAVLSAFDTHDCRWDHELRIIPNCGAMRERQVSVSHICRPSPWKLDEHRVLHLKALIARVGVDARAIVGSCQSARAGRTAG